MAIFLITPLTANFDQIGDALRAGFDSSEFIELQHRAGYLVSFKGTSVELSHRVGITSQDRDVKSSIGSAMVTLVGSYFGRGPTTMWEWMKSRIENQ